MKNFELSNKREIFARVPEQLAPCKEALGVGLYLLILGKNPEKIPQGNRSYTRFKVSQKAYEFYEDLLPQFSNKTETVTLALALAAEQAPHVRMTRI